jgi:hypothetical protein
MQVTIQYVWSGSWEFALLTGSQMNFTLVISKPVMELQGPANWFLALAEY